MNFLASKDVFKDAAIDDHEHDMQLQEVSTSEKPENNPKGNCMPKAVVKLENLFDFQDRFKKPTNCKTNMSSMKYEVINLGTETNPQNVNLGECCSPSERAAYIKLFREFKDIFAWTYDDLKTFDTRIIQHSIPLKTDVKPYQQKLRKFHPDLEPQMKQELKKLLDAKIIFPVRHTEWVANLVPVRKKNGDIRLCVNF